MSELNKQDLHEFKIDLKEMLDTRFKAHEEVEKLMLQPVIKRVAEHEKILHGDSGRGGVIKDVTLFGWLATGGLLAGVSKWVNDLLAGMFK